MRLGRVEPSFLHALASTSALASETCLQESTTHFLLSSVQTGYISDEMTVKTATRGSLGFEERGWKGLSTIRRDVHTPIRARCRQGLPSSSSSCARRRPRWGPRKPFGSARARLSSHRVPCREHGREPSPMSPVYTVADVFACTLQSCAGAPGAGVEIAGPSNGPARSEAPKAGEDALAGARIECTHHRANRQSGLAKWGR